MHPSRRTFRFAPSPNGRLHLGHAYSALLNQRLAEAAKGDLLLRMEDIDTARCTAAFEASIKEDLHWLGFRWHGSIRRQSDHFALYGAALDLLAARQLLYPCFCTRGDIARALVGRSDWPRDPDGSSLYPGTCRHLDPAVRARFLAEGRPFQLRLDMAAALKTLTGALVWTEYREGETPEIQAANPAAWGDAVLRRKDIPASYHIAVVVDDALQGITDVVRGADLLEATGLHRLLQELLGSAAPAYHHHRLILDVEAQKLSKSRQSPTLVDLRQSGATPEDVRRLVGLA
jgi:glutamyl-Q tRNA(Asp) synthetase